MENKKPSIFAVALIAIYSFFIMGGVASLIAITAYVPEYVGISLVEYSAYNSLTYVVVALVSFTAVVIYKKFGSKTCMLFGSCMMILSNVILGLFPNVPSIILFSILNGLIQGAAGFTCMADLLVRLYGASAPAYISFVMGAGTVGMGIFQGLAGTLYVRGGVRMICMGENLVCGIVALVCVLLIRIPKETETAAQASLSADAETGTETPAPAAVAKTGSIFQHPAAWCIFIALLFMPLGQSPSLMYATAYFPSFGIISIEQAGLMVSIMGIATGAFSMIGGRILMKVGPKTYAMILTCGTILLNVFALLYGRLAQSWVLVLVVLAYTLAGAVMTLPGVLGPTLFGTDLATSFNTRAMGFMYAGNIVGPILLASLISNMGYRTTFIAAAAAAAACFVLMTLSFSLEKKETAN